MAGEVAPRSPRVVKSLMSMLFVPEEEPTPIGPVWGMEDERSFDQSSRDDEGCLCCSCCEDSDSMFGWGTH